MAPKRKPLSIETKLAILQAVDSGRKKKDIAEQFGIPASTLSTVISLRGKIEDSATASVKQDRKRFRAPTFPDVEEALFLWFKDARSRNLPVSGAVLEQKANSLAFLLGHEDFKATSGWISRFKERRDIVCLQLSGEASSVPDETLDAWFVKSQPIINRYAERDVYNMDETGLFFKMLPERTLAMKGEKCHGGKKSKERLTIGVACNMDGSDKRKLCVIGKSKKPRCFKGVHHLPVDYQANRKAWMTMSIFEVWLKDFDRDMLRQKRKVLLVLDNCTAHKVTIKLEAVELLYLPPNTTSKLQPLDQGIIRSLKAHYRKRIVAQSVFNMDSGRETVITVKSAIDMIYGSWNSVDPVVIKNCFRKARFSHQDLEAEDTNDPDELWDRLGVKDATYDEFINADENVETTPEMCDADIVKQVKPPAADAESSSEDDEIAPVPRISSLESLDMISKLKDFVSGLAGAKEADVLRCLSGLQNCEMLVMSTPVVAKQKKISDFFK